MPGRLAWLVACCLAASRLAAGTARAEEPAAPAPPPARSALTGAVGPGVGVTRQLERGGGGTSLLSVEAGVRLGHTWRGGLWGSYGYRPDARSFHLGVLAGRAFWPLAPLRVELLAEGGLETAAPEEVDDSVEGTRHVEGGRVTLPIAGARLHLELPGRGVGLAVFLRSTWGSREAHARIERCFAGTCTTAEEVFRFGGPAAGIAFLLVGG